MRYVIIPDVHGRDFWKKAIPLQNSETELVFLGDYFDPYDITPSQAIHNFDEMVATLDLEGCEFLIGNHDAHYLWDTFPKASRYSEQYAEDIKKRLLKLKNNHDVWDYTWFTINHVSYLLTHAGVNKAWLDRHTDLWNLDKLGLFGTNDMERIFASGEVGKLRGGWYKTGGYMWADVHEMDTPDIPYYQIFGHTQLTEPIIKDKWACLDCQRIFIVDDNGLHEYREDSTDNN